MVYHPYFRGKQFELGAIRETVALLAQSHFTPIIEPVREQLKVLRKTIDLMCESDVNAILVVNPQIGDHTTNQAGLNELLSTHYAGAANVAPGLLMTQGMGPQDAVDFSELYGERQVALIHSGTTDGANLALALNGIANIGDHIFMPANSGKLYIQHFQTKPGRTLVRDGFKLQVANRDYPATEFYSDLHVTYQLEGMDGGFGDFLTVGDHYREGGGPAYAVAIHITFIDPSQDNGMYIHHFLSDSQNTPTNPAGKFAEAVAKLITAVDAENSPILETAAVAEFREFHKIGRAHV